MQPYQFAIPLALQQNVHGGQMQPSQTVTLYPSVQVLEASSGYVTRTEMQSYFDSFKVIYFFTLPNSFGSY